MILIRNICLYGALGLSLFASTAFAKAKGDKTLRRPVEWHVSVSGDDNASGTSAAPLRHIQTAAEKARPGDVITVHAGTYRERVAPPCGGDSKERPIVFQAAKGEKVEIKGSEVIKNWKRLDEKTWVAVIPNRLFEDFNPYQDTIHGDWLERGQWCHTGEVYLNDVALNETDALENVLMNGGETPLWFCKVDKENTWIWANFFQANPNEELAEINVRQTVFYPRKPFVNYITVRGFHLSHAATPWAPPTAEQIGLIGTHWSKGWVIEENDVRHSKCVGITLGKYGDEWDNKAESVEGYIKTTQRALDNHWNRDSVGSHLVRGNRVSWCGQAGIAGSLGAIFSTVEENVVHDISRQKLFWGYELAGIKLHGAVDAVIRHNHIYRTEGGIWLDWMTQGTRITRNLLHDNEVQDFSLEVNHGPILVDNNLFLSTELAQVKLSQGVAFVHNTIAWKIWPTGKVDERATPYLLPHDTRIAGYHDCPCGNVSYFNNLFIGGEDLSAYKDCSLPVQLKGNAFDAQAQYKVVQDADGWYLEIAPSRESAHRQTVAPVRLKQLPDAVIPNQPFDMKGVEPVFDKDYVGKIRNKRNGVVAGALVTAGNGQVRVKVYDN
ncbi:MAG: right-handed parallel beta-helix repeat-containing protein [Bacteroides sp.]|nr:right-handed parallel beta-helix repeat-containing protein [Bacteroides sp.]